MNSLRISVRRAGSVFAALALVLSTALPGIVSAAQVTERSIALSSSSADASGVRYTIKFTAATDATKEFVIDFCKDSPLVGSACANDRSDAAHLAGFTAASATSSDATITASATTVKAVLATAVDTGDEVTVELQGIHNPTAAGTFYARVVTYADGGMANYTSPTSLGAYLDDGGVAMSITPTIAVSGAVLESLQFCVSGEDNIAPIVAGDPIGAGCTNATYPPTLKLGTDVGGVVALDSQQIYEGTIYTQLSTNAASGAVVSLKSNTLGCGGLMRSGEPDPTKGCGIAPAGALTFTAGQAKFGVKLGTAAGVGTSNGVYQAFDTGGSPYYNSSAFKLNAATNNLSGVTSTFGDKLLDTDGAPLNNMNMPITFGASAAANTPAGNYSAELSLIATGKF